MRSRSLRSKTSRVRPRSKYEGLGIDPSKKDVVFLERIIDSVFPKSFSAILPDVSKPGTGIVLHVDGAGSKPVLAYLNWKVSGDASYFGGLAQDVVAMNVDDVVTVGARPIALADYVSLNRFHLDGGVLLRSLSLGFRNCLDLLRRNEMPVMFAGGETADLPDQVETFDIAGTVLGEVGLAEAITGRTISPGDIIVGLASGGQSRYERRSNSGIMCNGITLARHHLLSRRYNKLYPETYRSSGRRYAGKYEALDHLDEIGMSVGEALTSPSRIFAPIVSKMLQRCGDGVKALVHNTGGGLTKCLRVGRNVRYIKDSLPVPDPIFLLIKSESGETWRQMCVNFNMGIGFEVIVKPSSVEEVIRISESFNVGASTIGRCERGGGRNSLTVKSDYGKFTYTS